MIPVVNRGQAVVLLLAVVVMAALSLVAVGVFSKRVLDRGRAHTAADAAALAAATVGGRAADRLASGNGAALISYTKTVTRWSWWSRWAVSGPWRRPPTARSPMLVDYGVLPRGSECVHCCGGQRCAPDLEEDGNAGRRRGRQERRRQDQSQVR